jgi:TIR domain
MSCEIFMSYTSIKDLYGAVGEFRNHLETELRKKTGNTSLTVFQDKRDIHGGEKWEEILRDRLGSAQLLLILLSPTWLTSEWCRREYRVFVSADAGTSASRPVVPLVWDKVSEHDARTPEQQNILNELRAHQMLTWDELQYADWTSPEPNRAAGRLAEELKVALKACE